jgi:hypothetical protein
MGDRLEAMRQRLRDSPDLGDLFDDVMVAAFGSVAFVISWFGYIGQARSESDILYLVVTFLLWTLYVARLAIRAVRRGQVVAALVLFLVALVLGLAYFGAAYGHASNGFRVADKVMTLRPSQIVYFVIVTFATVGYGDIAPATADVRTVVAVNIVFNFIMTAGILTLLVGVVVNQMTPAEPPLTEDRFMELARQLGQSPSSSEADEAVGDQAPGGQEASGGAQGEGGVSMSEVDPSAKPGQPP